MSTILEVYDFEGVIEAAIQQVLTDAGIYCITSRTESVIQEQRPRVEIMLQVGQAREHYQNSTGSSWVNDAWTGTLSMMLITDGATPLSHAQFRATLRHVMSTMDERMKGTNLTYHTVNSFIDTGTSPASKADNNAEISQMQYQVAFNIKPDAWPITE